MLEQRFWKGRFMLATRQQVEDGDWWDDNRVALAVSMNAGCFHEVGNTRDQGWFAYPVGRRAMNIPIMSKKRCVQRTRSCLPHILAVLACGKNVAVHCLNTCHRGPAGFMLLVMSLYPHDIKPEMAPNVLRAIKAKWDRTSSVLLQARRPDRPRDAALWDRCHELVKDVLPGVRVPNHILRGGPPAATGGWTVEQVRHWEQVACIIEGPVEKPRLAQLMLLLSDGQKGLAQGLPVAELAEVHEEWRRSYGPDGNKGQGQKGETRGGKSGKGKGGKVTEAKGGETRGGKSGKIGKIGARAEVNQGSAHVPEIFCVLFFLIEVDILSAHVPYFFRDRFPAGRSCSGTEEEHSLPEHMRGTLPVHFGHHFSTHTRHMLKQIVSPHNF